MATTTNYTWDLPTVGGDEDAWGTKLNSNWTALDTLLGGVNATEFAILDGATVTTAELNLLDGVTWTLTNYNTLTATATELNLLDGLTAVSGADLTIITGTSGADGNLAQWNADGDLVDYGAATQLEATWEAGTSTTESLVTPAKVKAAIEALAPNPVGSALSWTSWANGSESSVAHSLGSAPTIWFAYMECTSADVGFSVGDIVPINYSHSSAGFNGATTYADATNVYLRVGSAGFNTYSSSGAYTTDFNPTKWTAKVRIIS